MGETPNDTWSAQLRGLSMEEWIAAITKLNESTDDWPPTLSAFKRWAQGLMSADEAKEQAIWEWENRPSPKYNPFVTPPTHEQEERNRRNFIQRRVAEVRSDEEACALGIERSAPVDPRRICQDEELR